MKIITVDVSRLQRGDSDCIDLRRVPENELWRGCRVEVAGESRVVFDANRAQGARVWVETDAPVTVHGKDGSAVVIS